MGMNKGQIFVAAAIIFVVGLFLFRNMVMVSSDVNVVHREKIDNIAREFRYVFGLEAVGSGNVADFSEYVVDNIRGLKLLYVYFEEDYVTVGNFMQGKEIITVNSEDFVLENGEIVTNTVSTSGNIEIIYTIYGRTISKVISFDNTKSYSIGYYNIILEEGENILTEDDFVMVERRWA